MKTASRTFSRMLLATFVFVFAVTLHAATTKLVVTNATIITLEKDQPEPFKGYLVIDSDGRISAIAPGAPGSEFSSAKIYDAGGKIVMPGFLSGHSHLWQSAFRGIAAGVRTWSQLIHGTYGPFFRTGDVYAFTMHGALDYLRHGITTTYNYSQNLGFPPELYEEQFQAEWDAGQRFIFGYAPIPRAVPGMPRPSLEVIHENFKKFMARVKTMPANPLFLKVNIAASSFSEDDVTQFEFDLMREYSLDLSTHFLESPSSEATSHDTLARIEKAHGLGPWLIMAHFIQADDYIVEKTGAAGVGMSWNPLSNGRLANGVVDIPKYIKAGVKVGMGIDGQASADVSDPFENMRMGLYGIRNKYKDPAIMMPIDVLRYHTIGTAEVFGVGDKVGSLKVGKFADFLIVDPAEPDTGPVYDVYSTLVFACSMANVERIYVGGNLAVEHSKVLVRDFPAVTKEVQARVQTIRGRIQQSKAGK